MIELTSYREVWLVDFEFGAPAGERPDPRCLVAHELRSGTTIRLWRDEFGNRPPYGIGDDVLLVAYSAAAELTCHLALGWPLPAHILDLFVEFRRETNGVVLDQYGLIGALTYYGLDAIGAAEKEEMRQLALRGGTYTEAERTALLTYCESDVVSLGRLLSKMLPVLDLPRALLRGRYVAVVAEMEHRGIPIDADALRSIQTAWQSIREHLVEEFDHAGVFEGTTFKLDRFARVVHEQRVAWPRLPSGQLDLKADTFKDMARVHPEFSPLRELRRTLGQLRLTDFAVGVDGRNRVGLRPFTSRTSRNQPSSTKFVFGMPSWLRSLIGPEPGMALAYIDWSQQEFGIAAALAKDDAMMAAYTTGDPYLAFAVQAGAVPPGATKKSHSNVREQFKACALAVLYGMGVASLAERIGRSPAHAAELLELHRLTYPRYWRWSDAAVDHAMLRGSITTSFGWRIRIGADANDRSVRNFPVQANGAEMLRLACIFASEAGVGLCAPVHDAVLIEAPATAIDAAVVVMQQAMARASRLVLGGFELRSEADVIRHPDRYEDERGRAMWNFIERLLASGTCAPVQHVRCTSAHPPILISLPT